MFSDQRSNGSRDALESGLKQLTSFLRAPRLPGKARLNRADPPAAGGEPSASPRSGGSPQRERSQAEENGGEAAASYGRALAAEGAGPAGSPGAAAAAPAAAAGASDPDSRGGAAGSSGAQQADRQLAGLRLYGGGEPPASTGDGAGAASSGSSSSGAGALGPSGGGAAAGADGAATSGGGGGGGGVSQSRASSAIRVKKFHKILSEQVVDLDALRELAWSGIPSELRPLCWRLLLGYLPPNKSRQAQVLLRKRREYAEMVPEFYDIANSERSEDEIGALRQVSVDVPRTAPTVPFFHEPVIQKSLERMLYIWGIRHPASGYVQGMNDLVTPFLAVFLSDCLKGSMDEWGADQLTEPVMLDVEADCYWCLCKLLEGIQDHYTYAQPGIQRTVFRLKELVRKQHEPLVAHMEAEGVDFLQFAFRWVNCLLIREVPFDAALRLWDTYLAEGTKFADFLVYVCAAFLARWERPLMTMEFQELMLFLQKLPTQEWGESEMESVLSSAFVLRNVWQHAQSHLQA